MMVRDRVMLRARVRVRVRVRKRKRGRNKARSVRIEPKTREGSEKRAGKKKKSVMQGRKHAGKNRYQGMGLQGSVWGRG